MEFQPPKWALNFLRWFCKDEYLNEIEGDLLEMFHRRSEESKWKANTFFIWNVLRSFRLINMKGMELIKSNGMWRNYLKVGYRSLRRESKFTLINLIGLAMGLAIFFTIIQLVNHEYSYDTFHSKGDRIFEVIQVFENADGEDPEIWTSFKLADALENELSIVEKAVSIHGAASTWVTADNERFFEEEGIVAGAQFFDIFDFKLLKGTKEQALSAKRSIVLSASLARKYFDHKDPIGETVSLDFYGNFTVSAVMEDIPSNSYIQFNYIITQDYDVFFQNVASWFPEWFLSWDGDEVATYVLLKNAKDKVHFEEETSKLLHKHLGPDKVINRHYLLGLSDLHFHSNGIDGRVNDYRKGDEKQVGFLILIAFIILIMACFNYVNISTARYLRRTKEVGVRKALGAIKKQVMMQFLTESFLVVAAASLLGFALIEPLLSYMNVLTGIDLILDLSQFMVLLPVLIITIIVVTVLAGLYPSFYLSRFQVTKILKNTIGSSGNTFLRQSLVSIQYGLVIAILGLLFIVNQQYDYLQDKEMGFDTEELVVIEVNSGPVRNNYRSIKSEIQSLAGVENVTGLTRMINGYRSGAPVKVNASTLPDDEVTMRFYGMDEDGPNTLGLDLIHGSGFKGTAGEDSTSVILNESAAAVYGGIDAIGTTITVRAADEDHLTAKVIGIVKDFHYESLHNSIGPVVLGYYLNPIISLDDIVVKLSGGSNLANLEAVEKIHNRYDTNDMMTWEFLDDMMQRAYEKEKIFRDVFVGASIVSFIIAILGMIGLSSYNISARKKETAIRKILGAGLVQLFYQHAREFMKFLIIASLVAIPLCWWLASQWLINFEYRIDIAPQLFLGIVSFVLLITILVILIVGGKSLKSNPVDSIRYE